MGGAIFSYGGTLAIFNSTFVSNNAVGGPSTGSDPTTAGQGLGGAIFLLSGSITIQNCTIAGNTAAQGGGTVYAYGGNLTINSTVLANSAGGVTDFQCLQGNVAMTGAANLIRNNAASPNGFTGGIASTADPALAALAFNGGPTKTLALLPGSPCINTGGNPANLTTDQRGPGFVRVSGAAADIGAFEVQPGARVQSVKVGDGSLQRSRVTALTVTFDTSVVLPANPEMAFTLRRQSDNTSVALIGSAAGNSVTLTFAAGPAVAFGSLADGRYALAALASQINNGNFDGNGDGTAGDNYLFSLHRLFGDADGDADVDIGDLSAFRLAFLAGPSIFDADGDGDTDVADLVAFRRAFGGSLP